MMRWMLITLLHLYQILVSPFLGGRCRFYPSCSEYAIGCIRRYGSTRGSLLAMKRIMRCHPYNSGGVDPVP